MEISDLRSRLDRATVLVIGLGKSGVAAAVFLRERGARVIATDRKPPGELQQQLRDLERCGARFVPESELEAALDGVALAVLSPGVPLDASPVAASRARGIAVIAEVELAAWFCAAPIVAVTGTKGKSTTTALVAHLLRASGKDVRVGGNIGEPLVAAIAGATVNSWIVAELSSFQLETIVTFRPRVAAVLNIAPDHLDRYGSIEAYASAKFRIFERQGAGDAIVLDADDPRLAALEQRFAARGCEASRLWYTLREPGDGIAMGVRNGVIVWTPEGRAPRAVAACADVPLPGAHNVRNAMAALLCALATGASVDGLADALRTFRGLPHRLETVAEIDGVRYVDDSKATNPSAAAAALRAFDAPVVLIAGGRQKGTGFEELAAAIRDRAKAVVAIGEATPLLAGLAGDVPFEAAASLEQAVDLARRAARCGDVVLLAPACASFDMFLNAEERGARFARAVETMMEAGRA